MPKGIFLTCKDVMKLRGHRTQQNAWKYLKTLSIKLGKSSPTQITIDDFCNYYKVEKQTVLNTLKN